ncbi:MAG: hypothetical protein NTV09_02905 [Bacteroidetes bacterium]|nr:hypothetical protein [Bacteroidota bacterium]
MKRTIPTLIIPGPALIPKSSPSVKRKRLLQGPGFSLRSGLYNNRLRFIGNNINSQQLIEEQGVTPETRKTSQEFFKSHYICPHGKTTEEKQANRKNSD